MTAALWRVDAGGALFVDAWLFSVALFVDALGGVFGVPVVLFDGVLFSALFVDALGGALFVDACFVSLAAPAFDGVLDNCLCTGGVAFIDVCVFSGCAVGVLFGVGCLAFGAIL